MPAINITDLNNAKLDVDHIAEMATSLNPTATDRLGHIKQTMSGIVADLNATAVVTETGVNRAAAQAAKTAAELARDAAQLSAGVYATTADGLAATTGGQYFSVPSPDSDEYLILYINSTGVAVEQKRYPSLTAIQSLLPPLPGNAVTLLGTELEGLAIDATTDSLSSAVQVTDLATPANNYTGTLQDFLAATCFPSPKIIRKKDGTLGWSDHNLIYNSETFSGWVKPAPAATIAAPDASGLCLMTATGSTAMAWISTAVSDTGFQYVYSFIAKKGTAAWFWMNFKATTDAFAYFNFATGAVGTVTAGLTANSYTTYEDGTSLPAGEFRFVMSRIAPVAPIAYFGICNADASTTSTTGITGYLRHSAVSRGIATTGYLATTAAARYGIPYDWSRGVCSVLIEEILTRFRSKYSDDLTQAAWATTNVTPVYGAIGPMGEPCSTLTATAANGTCLQACTISNTGNTFQAQVKRRSGTGPVSITIDGGTTWVDVTTQINSAAFVCVNTSKTAANPTIGFRLGTSGDAIDVALALVGENIFLTSPVPTLDPGGSYYQRVTDSFRIPFTKFHMGVESTAFFDFEYSSAAGEALCGIKGASDFHYVGSDASVAVQRVAIVGGVTTRNYLGNAPENKRIEASFRLKVNDFSANVNGFSECYDNRTAVGTLNNIFAGNGANQIFLRRVLVIPRALDDDALPQWSYSGSGADARYIADKKVAKFGEIAGTHINREPSLSVFSDTITESLLSVSWMQRNATNNTGHAELPGRLVRRQFIFNKVTQALTAVASQEVIAEQASWASGLGHLQGGKQIKIKYGALKGRLLLIYTQLDSAAGTLTPDWRRIYCKYSDDNGVTWSASVVICDIGTGYFVGTCGGDYVEFTEGVYAGRIAVPIYKENASTVLYSDNKGVTWALGAWVNDGGAEPTLALRPDGSTLVMTTRLETSPWRNQTASIDGGATWSAYAAVPSMGGTRVYMSTVQNDAAGSKGTFGELLLVGARKSSPEALYRSQLTVEQLGGEALTPSGVQFCPVGTVRATGYAHAVKLSGEYLAIGYESTPTADPNNICEIRLMVVCWP